MITDEMMEKMPSKKDFNVRLIRLGIMDENGNVNADRIEELSDVSQDQMM